MYIIFAYVSLTENRMAEKKMSEYLLLVLFRSLFIWCVGCYLFIFRGRFICFHFGAQTPVQYSILVLHLSVLIKRKEKQASSKQRLARRRIEMNNKEVFYTHTHEHGVSRERRDCSFILVYFCVCVSLFRLVVCLCS